MGGFKAAAALLVLILVANEVGVSLALGESAIKGTTAGGGGTDPTGTTSVTFALPCVTCLAILPFPLCDVFATSEVGVSLGAPAAKGTTAAGLCAPMAANAAAASDVVRLYVRMGTVMLLLGSLVLTLFASPDCSGAAAAKYQNTGYQNTGEMSAFKMDTSVKSIRCVLGECTAATMR
ncbi:unnamed protein product [Closterium sp. Naga37s-1]|nr:unnamed protein product [Closterium sp. Naga37s-1]